MWKKIAIVHSDPPRFVWAKKDEDGREVALLIEGEPGGGDSPRPLMSVLAHLAYSPVEFIAKL